MALYSNKAALSAPTKQPVMKKIFTLLLVLTSLFSFSQSTTLVISQFYGAGGNTGATLNADYVELHNLSAVAQSTAGMSIQYSSATNTGTWTGVSALPTVSIPAGGYYLIQMSSTGANGAALPTPDYVSNPTIAMSGTNGKVALVNNLTALSGCPAATDVIDLVGYGTANCSETATTPALTTTTAGFRNNNGCTETNNNSTDFTMDVPAPRNSASPVFLCGGPAGPSITTTALTAFGNVCVNTTIGPNSFTINGTNLTIADITVGPLAAYTFSLTSGGTYTASLTIPHAAGTVSIPVFVKFTPTAIASYNGNIPVNGGGITTAVNVAVQGAGSNVPPSLTTGGASAITSTSATVAGSIPSSGCTAVNAYGIEFSTVNGFVPGTGTQVSSTNLAGTSFTSALATLTPGTTYYYVAYATNQGGTGYGTQLSFTTAPPTTPNFGSATLTGFGSVCVNTTAGPNNFVLTGSNLTNADIVVGPLAGYTFSSTSGGTYTASLTITQAGGSFSQPVFVKFTPTAIATYNGNIPLTGAGAPAASVAVTGEGVNVAPSLTTGAASAITSSSATLAGSITSIGCTAVTAYGIEFSLVNGFANGSGTQVPSTNLAAGSFTSALSLLAPSTTYYYKAYATNAAGTAWGTQMSFTTAAPPPPVLSVTTLADFGTNCLNTTAGPNSFDVSGINLTTADIKVGPLAGFSFSTSATGTFEDSLFLTQAGGSFTQTVYVQFTPAVEAIYDGNIRVAGAGAPALTVPVTGSGVNTQAFVVSDDTTLVNPNNVIARGSILNDGCTPVTAYGIEYSGINGFVAGTGIKVPSTNLSGTSFSSNLTGLVQNTAYYYRAYAINNGGTAYGAQKTFFSPAIPAGLILYNTPVIRGTNLHFSLSGIKPGHYAARIYNSVGQLVFQKDMIVQLNFIDDNFTLPGYLPIGPYTFQIYNHELRIQKSFMVQ